ncbi:hypothetical protein ACWC9T_17945 [Kitasatospora sp. NPDC001159]
MILALGLLTTTAWATGTAARVAARLGAEPPAARSGVREAPPERLR